MWKRLALDATITVAVVAVALGRWWIGPHPEVTNYNRIRVGMTRQQVEAMIGRPPGDYSLLAPKSLAEDGRKQRVTLGDNVITWRTQGAILRVGLDENGAVIGKEFVEMLPDGPSRLDRIRRWLGL